MADVPNFLLTIDDLNQFLVEKTAHGIRCPVCNTSNFHLVENNDPNLYVNLYIAKPELKPVLTGTSIPAAAVYCDNCGYLLLFSRVSILAWKAAKK